MRVVSENEAKQDPYPVVYVEHSGAYREVTDDEKVYLETDYHGADGNRPYVKSYYRAKAPDGSLHGYLERSDLPRGLEPGEILAAKPWWFALDIRQWMPRYSTILFLAGFWLFFAILVSAILVLGIGALLWMLDLYFRIFGPVGLVLFLLSLGVGYKLFWAFVSWRRH